MLPEPRGDGFRRRPTQATICAAWVAPGWRLSSRPPFISSRVGMLRIAKRAEVCGLASLSTLANSALP